MIIACSTPFTVLVEVVEQLRLLAAGEGRDAAQRLAQLVPVAQQEEQHHQEDHEVEDAVASPVRTTCT